MSGLWPVGCEPVGCEPVGCGPVACGSLTCGLWACGLWPVGRGPVGCGPVDCGQWAVGCGPVACGPVACGLWAVGCGLWAVGCGLWAVGCGLWAVGLWACGLWAVGCGPIYAVYSMFQISLIFLFVHYAFVASWPLKSSDWITRKIDPDCSNCFQVGLHKILKQNYQWVMVTVRITWLISKGNTETNIYSFSGGTQGTCRSS